MYTSIYTYEYTYIYTSEIHIYIYIYTYMYVYIIYSHLSISVSIVIQLQVCSHIVGRSNVCCPPFPDCKYVDTHKDLMALTVSVMVQHQWRLSHMGFNLIQTKSKEGRIDFNSIDTIWRPGRRPPLPALFIALQYIPSHIPYT